LALEKLSDLHNELLEHPPYSPDLAASDFYLFPKQKLFLAGQSFSSNEETIAAAEIMLKNKNNFEIINSFFHF